MWTNTHILPQHLLFCSSSPKQPNDSRQIPLIPMAVPSHASRRGLRKWGIHTATGAHICHVTDEGLHALQFKSSGLFGTHLNPISFCPAPTTNFFIKHAVIEARANTREDSAKIRNRKLQRKFNGSPKKPRLSVFCSAKQLYATLVDDQNKKCLFYGSTLQRSIHGNDPCTAIEAAERVGEELVKACINLQINEISSYDRNGLARGERMQAFEIAISRHGFLPG